MTKRQLPSEFIYRGTNVTIRGVTVDTTGPNTDGCDPDSCTDVLIEDCVFNNGDDCIAVKSGRDHDGRRVNIPTQNVVIRNCMFEAGHGGASGRFDFLREIATDYAFALKSMGAAEAGGGVVKTIVCGIWPVIVRLDPTNVSA